MALTNKFLAPIDYGSAMVSSVTKIITLTTPLLIDSFDINVYRSAEYLMQFSQGSDFVSTKLQVIHNGANISLGEYATIDVGTPVTYTFDAAISLNNLELTVQCPLANITPVELKFSRVLFDR